MCPMTNYKGSGSTLLSFDLSCICLTPEGRHRPGSVVGYGMGLASSGDFRVLIAWWLAALVVAMVAVRVFVRSVAG